MSDLADRRRLKPIQLVCRQEGDVITVVPDDGDRFVVQTRKAIAALQAVEKSAAFEAQLRLLLRLVTAWGMTAPGVASIHLTLGDAGLLFLAVKDSLDYDPALEDSLSDLDLAIANDPDLDMIRLEVMALPKVGPVALDSFLHDEFSLVFDCAKG